MRKVGLVLGLALVGFACSEGVGQMLVDAGDMLTDAGNMLGDGSVPDAGAQDEPVTCNKSETADYGNGYTITYRWAEFDVDPGATEVTVCYRGNPSEYPLDDHDSCYRNKAGWYRGTSTGQVACGSRIDDNGNITENPDPISITVHR